MPSSPVSITELSYRNLLHFHMVVTHGSVSGAAEAMGVSQPTVSAQLRRLEGQLGGRLLRREGRGVAPTELGLLVARYADDIFGVSRELLRAVREPGAALPAAVDVGVADVVPQLLASHLLAPMLARGDHRVRVFMGHPSELLADLAVARLDVVISDAPTNEPVHHVRAFNHLLGASPVSFLAPPKLAARLAKGFPASLDGAPLLLPTPNTVLRRSLDHWLDSQGLTPRVVAEFEDPSLLMAFGESGLGAFPLPSVIAAAVVSRYALARVGETRAVEERFYAISTERRIRHPAVIALSQAARAEVFGA